MCGAKRRTRVTSAIDSLSDGVNSICLMLVLGFSEGIKSTVIEAELGLFGRRSARQPYLILGAQGKDVALSARWCSDSCAVQRFNTLMVLINLRQGAQRNTKQARFRAEAAGRQWPEYCLPVWKVAPS